MLLSDYIKKNYSSSRRAGFENFYNATYEAAWLKDVKVPSPGNILAHQKDIFIQMNGLSTMQKDPIIEALNKDIVGKQDMVDYFSNIDKNIQKIEKYIETLGGGKSEEEMINIASELDQNIKDLDSLIEVYMSFVDKLANMSDMNEVKYAFYPIWNRLSALENYAKSVAQGNDVPWPGTQDGFLKRITWTEYALKGQYLEIVGTDFFKKKFPNNIVLNTGSLKGFYNITGSFVNTGKMKEDIMILDNKTNFSISFTIGRESKVYEMTILEFVSWLEKNKEIQDIRLTEYGYAQLRAHLVAGVQVKATRSNRIKFGNINLSTAYWEQEGMALAQLGEIYTNKPETPSPLKKEHPDYEALFNYNLAHNINHVIGRNNKLLLTRTGITDIYSFILEQFNNARYFYAVKGSVQLDHLKKGLKIALDFIE